MLKKETGKFSIRFIGRTDELKTLYKESIFIGRLDTCEIHLDHNTVSRIHAGISFRDSRYFINNLSTSNVLTINGRPLGPQKEDVLADGDTIQIGPFTVSASIDGEDLITLSVQGLAIDNAAAAAAAKPAGDVAEAKSQTSDVLKVFWEKRSREKDEWGTRLRPTEKPIPGKAMFNWRPTRDLRRPWRFGLFVWAFLIVGAIGVYAFLKYPQAYAPKPLSNPHATVLDKSLIANMSNANSCTTCHTANEPLENACIKCHQAEQFHPTNTKAHEEAGITCLRCHKEHRGSDFDMGAYAIASCAECHNDNNKTLYNGKGVSTPHGGSYGYPIVDGSWKWKGVYREVADAIPEIGATATGDADEEAKRSRHFHAIHVARLTTPPGVKSDSQGLVSCSTCHNGFDPLDKETPKQTCAVCHTTPENAVGRDTRFGASGSNCISCHTQHPYSGGRWNEFLTEDALKRRRDAIAAKLLKIRAQ